jgi:hypothetical protein
MRVLLLFSITLALFGCGRTHLNENKLNNDYLDKEIADRTIIISRDSVFAPELNKISKEVTNLTFLTVDIENINASINKSNLYFNEASKQYGVDTSGFVHLYKGVPLCDIVSIIKKNHLNLLNKIIMKKGTLMYTAQ